MKRNELYDSKLTLSIPTLKSQVAPYNPTHFWAKKNFENLREHELEHLEHYGPTSHI